MRPAPPLRHPANHTAVEVGKCRGVYGEPAVWETFCSYKRCDPRHRGVCRGPAPVSPNRIYRGPGTRRSQLGRGVCHRNALLTGAVLTTPFAVGFALHDMA